jgi:hypothetical protein
MRGAYQRLVDRVPFLPESRRADRLHRSDGVWGSSGEQHAPAQLRPKPAQPAHEGVLEAVDRIALRRRTGIEDRKQPRIARRLERFDLDPHITIAHYLEDLGEERHPLAVAEAHLADRAEVGLRNRPEAGQLGIVMHHDRAVPGRVHVELDAVGVEHDSTTKGGQRVLVLVSGGASVGDDAGSRHGRQR